MLSLLLIRVAPRLGWVDHPDQGRKMHTQPTARTGGLVLWAALALAQILGWLPWHLHTTDWVAIHGMALIGALDDRFDLRPRYKSLLGLLVAILLASHAAVGLSHTVSQVAFFDLVIPTHPLLVFPLLFAWFWGIPQAYNLIDGINGLSMGLGLLVLTVLHAQIGVPLGFFSGALLAVLLLNFPRAQHFLGDCGALMLGTLFAVMAIKQMAPWDADLPVWLLAYPIVDVCLVVAIRKWKHQPFSTADRSHLHHWMMDRVGQRAWLATPILLTLAALPMLRATDLPGGHPASVLGLVLLAALAFKAFLDRILPAAKVAPAAQARREIPYMAEAAVREPSGTHRSL
jgi:UDP-GlcNAc:undecaprenyl-phosphate GlcNAc-1-phosphate transferase